MIVKIGLILPGNYWYAPYVRIYEEVLRDNEVDYDILCWNRDGTKEDNTIAFNHIVDANSKRYGKLISFLRYINYLKSQVKLNKYDKLIIFGPQVAILMGGMLSRMYSRRFILDYRDVSIEQIFKRRFRNLLKYSSMAVISSNGYKSVLPDHPFIISHNYSRDQIDLFPISNTKLRRQPFTNDEILISTIGAIRDFASNYDLVKSLLEKDCLRFKFVGKGSGEMRNWLGDSDRVQYLGYYEKKEESNFFIEADFINIYYPDVVTHKTAMSNRFYNALFNYRPMIVRDSSIQAEYVKEYKLGVVISDLINAPQEITRYIEQFKYDEFQRNCMKLIGIFEHEYTIFRKEVEGFIKASHYE